MNAIKIFLKNINVLNLLLLAILVFLFLKLNDSLIDKKIIFTISKPKEVLIEGKEKTDTEITANYLDYIIITEKNLFHPARKVASGIKDEQEIAKPEIILYGTLMMDEKKIAYIEDKKNPYSTPGRGKRQVAINEGEVIAGYKLEKVNAESIVLVRGTDKITVTLSTQKERKPGESDAKKTLSGNMPDLTSGQIPPPLHPQARPSQPYMPPSPARPTLNSK